MTAMRFTKSRLSDDNPDQTLTLAGAKDAAYKHTCEFPLLKFPCHGAEGKAVFTFSEKGVPVKCDLEDLVKAAIATPAPPSRLFLTQSYPARWRLSRT